MNSISDFFLTPADVAKELAQRVKQRRLEQQLTQAELAKKADIPLSTYRRFEQTAQISLEGLLNVAFALGLLEDVNQLFTNKTWSSIDDMLQQTKTKQRVRHRR